MKARGDCFKVHGDIIAMDDKDNNFVLVHGEVQGRGPLTGVRFAHCWLELGGVVHDYSNGNILIVSAEVFYDIGGVIVAPGKLCKYSRDEACRKMLTSGHYGSWDLTCRL